MNQLLSRPSIAFVNLSESIQNIFTEYAVNRKIDCSFFKSEQLNKESRLFSRPNWDLLIFDSQIPIDQFDSLKEQSPNLPMIPWPDDDSWGEFEVKSVLNFLLLSVGLDHVSGLQVGGAVKPPTLLNDKEKDCPIIGQSELILSAIKDAKRVAGSEANIFLFGESGTGKELFAKFIHAQSHNSSGPFIAINCTAIPEALLESELFGHVKGSFTGAIANKVGLFEEAEGGTLFLDEIGDLSMALQVKLLRVIQERTIRRVGDTQYKPIHVRIISATHKNLVKEIMEDRFREDLYYRLNVIPIRIPSLRNRIDDILPLARHFLDVFSKENHSSVKAFSKEAIQYLETHTWKGNVRELQNAIERAVVMAEGEVIREQDFCNELEVVLKDSSENNENLTHQFSLKFDGRLPRLSEAIEKYIEFAVQFNGGAKDKTARELGIDRKTLYKKLNHITSHEASTENRSLMQ